MYRVCMMKWVESLFGESGPGLTLGDSCHFALLSQLPSSHFSNFFIIDFFAKLSLLFHPWKRISLPFIMLPKCQRLNGPDARVGCYHQSNFFRSNNNHKFLHKSLSKFSLRISTKRQLRISTTSKYWPDSSFKILIELQLQNHDQILY